MRHIRTGVLCALLITSLSACLTHSDPPWHPNTTGVTTGDDIFRESVPLTGAAADDAERDLLTRIELTLPASATTLTVDRVDMSWELGAFTNDDVTVLRTQLPRTDLEELRAASLCPLRWNKPADYSTRDWVMDLLNLTFHPGDLLCWGSLNGVTAESQRAVIIVVSDTDPALVTIANYDDTPAH